MLNLKYKYSIVASHVLAAEKKEQKKKDKKAKSNKLNNLTTCTVLKQNENNIRSLFFFNGIMFILCYVNEKLHHINSM